MNHAAEYDDRAQRIDEEVSPFPSLDDAPRHRGDYVDEVAL